MESNVLECGVCTNIFSEQHSPRILPCSHTFCGQCIDEIISSQRKRCPLCREEFTANSTEDLLFNRIAIDAVKQFSSMRKEQSSSRRPMKSFKDFNDDLRENFIKKTIANCKEVMSQIDYDVCVLIRMKDHILEGKKIIMDFKEKLKEIETINEDTLSTIDENIKVLKEKIVVVQEEERRFKDCGAKLEAAVDFTSAGPIMDDSLNDIHNFQKKVWEIKELLQENERKTGDIVKEVLKMQAGLRNATEEIIERVEEDLPKELAVKTTEGQRRIAPIKIGSKNEVFLSHLEEEDTQEASYAIPLESLRPKTSRMAFLDLEADNTYLGRIIIKVIDEGNLALNFLHMCAGDLGPSYANSSIFGIERKRNYGESVGFGDYVVEDTTSAKPVLSGVDWVRESKRDIYENTPAKEGDVRGWFDQEATCNDVSRFYIVLEDHKSWSPRDRFGVVVEGLRALKWDIWLYKDLKRLKIVNCGLVFFL